MTMLLNWRLWAALLVATALTAGGWKCYVLGENAGKEGFAEYRAEVEGLALKAEQDARSKEQFLNESNQKVTDNYESLKTATATAVKSLDADRQRLLSTLEASSGRPTGEDSAPGLKLDASPENLVLGGCLGRYEEVAGDAKDLSDQVIGLQQYISTVVKP